MGPFTSHNSANMGLFAPFAREYYSNETLPSYHCTRQEVAVGASPRSDGILENCLVSPSWNIPASTGNAVLPPFGRNSLETIKSNSPKNTAPSIELPTPPQKVTTEKRSYKRYTPRQTSTLEKVFQAQHYINRNQKIEISMKLGLTEFQVETWFLKRRLKAKKKQKKSDGSPKSHSLREILPLSQRSVSNDSSPSHQRVTNQNSPVNILQKETEKVISSSHKPPQYLNENETPLLHYYYNPNERLLSQQYSNTTEGMVYQHMFGLQSYVNYANAPQETQPNYSSFPNANQQYLTTIYPPNFYTMGHNNLYSIYLPVSNPNYQNAWSYLPNPR